MSYFILCPFALSVVLALSTLEKLNPPVCKPGEKLDKKTSRCSFPSDAGNALVQVKKRLDQLVAQGTSCEDTPGWENPHNYGCDDYASKGWCAKGAARKGSEWTLGKTFGFPEKHCLVCGKKCDGDTLGPLGYCHMDSSLVGTPAQVMFEKSCGLFTQSVCNEKVGACVWSPGHCIVLPSLPTPVQVIFENHCPTLLNPSDCNSESTRCLWCDKGTLGGCSTDSVTKTEPGHCGLDPSLAAQFQAMFKKQCPTFLKPSDCNAANNGGVCLWCKDTPKWFNPYGYGCDDYKSMKWCADGAATPGVEWALGEKFGFPEQHCCVCGKEPEPEPQPVPES